MTDRWNHVACNGHVTDDVDVWYTPRDDENHRCHCNKDRDIVHKEEDNLGAPMKGSRCTSSAMGRDCPYQPLDAVRKQTLSTWARTYAKPRSLYDFAACTTGSDKQDTSASTCAYPAAENEDSSLQIIEPPSLGSRYDYSSYCELGHVADNREKDNSRRPSSPVAEKNECSYQVLAQPNREKTSPNRPKPGSRYDYSSYCELGHVVDNRKKEKSAMSYASPGYENHLMAPLVRDKTRPYAKPHSRHDYSSYCELGHVADSRKKEAAVSRCPSHAAETVSSCRLTEPNSRENIAPTRPYVKPQHHYSSCGELGHGADSRKQGGSESPSDENESSYRIVAEPTTREKIMSSPSVKPRPLRYDCSSYYAADNWKRQENSRRERPILEPPSSEKSFSTHPYDQPHDQHDYSPYGELEYGDNRKQVTDNKAEKASLLSRALTDDASFLCARCGCTEAEKSPQQDEVEAPCLSRLSSDQDVIPYQTRGSSEDKTSQLSRVTTNDTIQCGRCGWAQREDTSKQITNCSFLPMLREWMDYASDDEREQAYDMFRSVVEGREVKGEDTLCTPCIRGMPQYTRNSRFPSRSPSGARYDYLDSEDNSASARWLWPRKYHTVLPQTGWGMLPLPDSCPRNNTSQSPVFNNAPPMLRRHYVIHPDFVSERRRPITRLCGGRYPDCYDTDTD